MNKRDDPMSASECAIALVVMALMVLLTLGAMQYAKAAGWM